MRESSADIIEVPRTETSAAPLTSIASPRISAARDALLSLLFHLRGAAGNALQSGLFRMDIGLKPATPMTRADAGYCRHYMITDI